MLEKDYQAQHKSRAQIPTKEHADRFIMNYNKTIKHNLVHMSYLFKAEDSHPRHKESRDVENVLVLQGGGSLGAFACGVFKALVKKNVRIDIVAGTSIGAVNAAIIVGSKSDHPEKELENFWIEVAESSPNIIPDFFVLDYDNEAKKYIPKKISAAFGKCCDVWCSQNVYPYMVLALVSLEP